MADLGPNPDLWMVTCGTRPPLKGLFYTQKCLSENLALLVVLLKQLLANCMNDCQPSCCSATLQRTEWDLLSFSGYCFVITV